MNADKFKDVKFEEWLEVNGLCVNCDDNRICRLSCYGSDVIYCEEYSVLPNLERLWPGFLDLLRHPVGKLLTVAK